MKVKIRLLLIAMTAIFMMVLTRPTMAYYTTIGKSTNVVTSGDIQLKIHEKTDDGSDFPTEGVRVVPGEIVSKRVTIENVCGHPFYLRVKLILSAEDQSLSAEDSLKIDFNAEDWTYVDGFYYYNRALQPREITPALFTEVEIVGEHVNNAYMNSVLALTLRAYAVQSENNPASSPWEASGWPAE